MRFEKEKEEKKVIITNNPKIAKGMQDYFENHKWLNDKLRDN